MKKKVLIIVTVFLVLIGAVGCFNKKEEEKTGLKFKNDYEELNGKENKSGKEHRTISISEDNKFIETTPEKMLEKIENGDSFYIYFGSRLCPWCRSIIESADKVSRENEIEKVYYIDIWDDEGNEIFRDKYELDSNNQPVKTFEGTEAYNKMLELFNDYLRDYELIDKDGNSIPTGEKRIYAPNFVYISHGKITRLITGKSSLQTEARGELTEDIKNEQIESFEKFFINACDDAC